MVYQTGPSIFVPKGHQVDIHMKYFQYTYWSNFAGRLCFLAHVFFQMFFRCSNTFGQTSPVFGSPAATCHTISGAVPRKMIQRISVQLINGLFFYRMSMGFEWWFVMNITLLFCVISLCTGHLFFIVSFVFWDTSWRIEFILSTPQRDQRRYGKTPFT